MKTQAVGVAETEARVMAGLVERLAMKLVELAQGLDSGMLDD